MVSEAGHYRNFIDLAKKYMPLEYVKKRWEEFLEEEKKNYIKFNGARR